jgi:hypothetical protein
LKPEPFIGERKVERRRKTLPLIEQNFHPGGWEPFGRAKFGWNSGEPSRKQLLLTSGEYFRREMHREFLFEAIAFAIIVLISAWPLTSLVLMLMRLIR